MALLRVAFKTAPATRLATWLRLSTEMVAAAELVCGLVVAARASRDAVAATLLHRLVEQVQAVPRLDC